MRLSLVLLAIAACQRWNAATSALSSWPRVTSSRMRSAAAVALAARVCAPIFENTGSSSVSPTSTSVPGVSGSRAETCASSARLGSRRDRASPIAASAAATRPVAAARAG